MSALLLTGGEIITPTEARFTDLWIRNGTIDELSDQPIGASIDGEVVDASGCFITPGLIDLQLNGGDACDFWGDPDVEQVKKFCAHLADNGVTSFLPTVITADIAHIRKNVQFLESIGAGSFHLKDGFAARMPGVHVEGPCLSPHRPGVHPPEWLKPLTPEIVKQLLGPSVKLITIAPELDPDGLCIELLKSQAVTPSLGHSNATFEEANQAFDRGIRLVTHTYNAMPPLHHRAPGAVVAAMLDDRVTCAVICDGLHVDPVAVKLLLKTKGVDKTLLVTDAAQIGTAGGGLVGSSIDLNQAVLNVVKWGVASFAEAVRMATFNPARALGMDNHIGHLAPGKCADVVLWDKNTLAIKRVIVGGKTVKTA